MKATEIILSYSKGDITLEEANKRLAMHFHLLQF